VIAVSFKFLELRKATMIFDQRRRLFEIWNLDLRYS
jgi:hypothetical protein